MNRESFSACRGLPTRAAIVILLAFLVSRAGAQSSNKVGESQKVQANPALSVEQELVRLENGFFEAWQNLDQAYFRDHMADNGIAWSDDGILSRDQEIAALQASAKTCIVEGYSLTDFGAMPIAAGTYLLTYKVDQYATCRGVKQPVHLNGSSIYILKAGRWQAVYRAQVPLKSQS